ncbi:MAG: SURF1 family protein [Pseudomonadota bacterium]
MAQAPHDPPSPGRAAPVRRSATLRYALLACAVLLVGVLLALGTWQVQRLLWKQQLIARVEQRVHAAPAAAPGKPSWPNVKAESDEYRHVLVSGTFLYELTTRVQAVTELGSGYWLLTPLCGADGTVVLVNRGYVPAGAKSSPANSKTTSSAGSAPACPPADGGVRATVTVNGLLRISEPAGGFLRNNDSAAERWYSRDVAAIAAARGLDNVAPYFIDADAAQAPAQVGDPAPVGGLTVISFHNNHLVYALTWYALAAMVVGALLWVAREGRKSPPRPPKD